MSLLDGSVEPLGWLCIRTVPWLDMEQLAATGAQVIPAELDDMSRCDVERRLSRHQQCRRCIVSIDDHDEEVLPSGWLICDGDLSRESGSSAVGGILPPQQAVTCSRVHLAPPPAYHLVPRCLTPKVHALIWSIFFAS